MISKNFLERCCLNIIQWGGLLLLLSPLIVVPSFFFPFVSPKGFYIMALCEVIFFAYLCLILFFPKYRPRFNLLFFVVSLFLLSLFLSTILSVSFLKSFFSNYERMTGFLFYLHLFGLFLVLIFVFEKKDWIKLLFFSVCVAGIVATIGIIAHFIGEEKIIFVSRDGSTLGNSSFFATYILFQVFFGLYLFKVFYKKKTKLFLLGTLLLLFGVSLFLSGGRAGFYSSLLGIFLVVLFYFAFYYQNPFIRKLGKIALLTYLLLIFASIILLCVPQSIVQNYFIQFSSKARPTVWQIAISGIKERPLFGWGIQNFDLVFARYFNPSLFLKEYGGEIWFDKAHNIIFDTLVKAGIFGLLSYLLIYLFAIGVLWQGYLKNKKEFWKAGIFSSLLLAYFVQGLTVFDTPISLLFFFLTLGFVATAPKQKEAEEQKINVGAKVCFQFILIFLILGFIFFEFIILPARASRLFIQTKNTQDPSKRLALSQKLLETTPFGKYQLRIYLAQNYFKWSDVNKASKKEGEFIARELKKSQKEIPLDLKTSLVLSGIYLELAEKFNKDTLDKAEKTATRAIQISPKNQQGYWLLAEISLLKGDCKKALNFSKYAYDLEPRVKASLAIFSEVFNRCKDELLLKKETQGF
ncbi:MAG: O-antigen ligase family protein [Candidatus Pacebacteria bacterium]|nr:O-antigen ligase family protein [Candidatus Paceibacterota bacterium]